MTKSPIFWRLLTQSFKMRGIGKAKIKISDATLNADWNTVREYTFLHKLSLVETAVMQSAKNPAWTPRYAM